MLRTVIRGRSWLSRLYLNHCLLSTIRGTVEHALALGDYSTGALAHRLVVLSLTPWRGEQRSARGVGSAKRRAHSGAPRKDRVCFDNTESVNFAGFIVKAVMRVHGHVQLVGTWAEIDDATTIVGVHIFGVAIADTIAEEVMKVLQ